MHHPNLSSPTRRNFLLLIRILPVLLLLLGPTASPVAGQATRPTLRVLSADSLTAPWINSSWTATVDLTNTEQVHSGSTAIKATLGAWGGLRLRSGDTGTSRSGRT